MAALTVQEDRSVSYVAEDQVFTIQVHCTSQGDLPDTGIFVFQVYNERNPSADIFLRVATVADIEAYSSDRQTAIMNYDTMWRSPQVTLTYDAVDVADQAVTVIKDRINALVADWEIYYNSFKTVVGVPEVIDFPTSDPAYVDSLKTDYSDAVDLYNTAAENEAAAKLEYDTASASLVKAQTDLQEWMNEYGRIAGLYDGTTLVYTGLAPEMTLTRALYYDLLNASTYTPSSALTINTALATFFSDPGHITSFPVLYAAYLAFQTTYQYAVDHASSIESGYTDHQTAISDVNAIVTTKQGVVGTAEDTLNSKKASYIEAQAATQEAYDNVISSYEAVKEVCPSWSPSPPLPPQP